MKKYVYLLIAIMPLTSIAQEKISFFNQNGKIEFQISKEEFFIKFDSKNEDYFELLINETDEKTFISLKNINGIQEKFEIIELIKNVPIETGNDQFDYTMKLSRIK